MRKELAAIGIAVLLAAGIGTSVAIQNGSTDSLNGQISQLQQQDKKLAGQLAQAETALGQATAKLNAASGTGDVITCSDLKSFETNIQVAVSGADAYGNYVSYTGIASSSWLPPHCYKP